MSVAMESYSVSGEKKNIISPSEIRVDDGTKGTLDAQVFGTSIREWCA